MIYVTGYKGRLGSELIKQGCKPFRARIDNPAAVTKELETTEDMNYLINCAAFTQVDEAEDDPLAALKANAIGPHILAQLLKPEVLLVQISTDYIFDGLGTPYSDVLPEYPRPLNLYGMSKAIGEYLIPRRHQNLIVIRTTNLFGAPGHTDFVTAVLEKLNRGEKVFLPHHITGNPTYIPDLAACLIRLVTEHEYRGIINLAGPEILSRYEVGLRIAKAWGFDPDLISEAAEIYNKAFRAYYNGLNVTTQREFGLVIRPVEEALIEMRNTSWNKK